MDRERMAWAAGLFEGEGCFSKDWRACLRMVDEDTVKQFQEIVGFGKIRGPVVPSSNFSKQLAYEWRVGSFEEVQATAAILWEWLSDKRKAQYVASLASASKYRRRT